MKKIIFLTLSLAFLTAGVFAQSSDNGSASGQTISPAQRAKIATDKINDIAQLSSEQYNQVLQVNQNYAVRNHGAAMAGGGRQTARLNAERDQQLKAILTPDQWQKVQSARNQGQ